MKIPNLWLGYSPGKQPPSFITTTPRDPDPHWTLTKVHGTDCTKIAAYPFTISSDNINGDVCMQMCHYGDTHGI